MSPQFVDFNGDGHRDIVTATFDGSPKVALGNKEGFQQPVHILDRDGARIVMNQFWDFDAKEWKTTDRCNPDGDAVPKGHLTSTVATDFDFDGDFDLLLGDHESGSVMLRRNEGTNAKPLFAPRNEVVLADGKPLIVPGTVTTLKLIDCNGDGREDLLIGSMGDPYGEKPGGAVMVHQDVGKAKARAFGGATLLVPVSMKDSVSATRPDTGLHMDLLDHDGDGDLDLIVGGYAHWTLPEPVLSAEQKEKHAELKAKIASIDRERTAFYQQMEEATKGLEKSKAAEKQKEFLASKSEWLAEVSKARAETQKAIEPMEGGSKRRSSVWFFENVSPRAVPGGR